MNYDHDLQALQEMRNAVQRAKSAQGKYSRFTQEQVDKIVKAVADAAFSRALELAELAVEETGMGIVEHKKIKNEVGSRDVYESIKNEKTVGIINEDSKTGVTEVATPFGLIAGIIPTTNPTSTAIFKTLISLKTRNGIVVSPHPRALKCTIKALEICSEAAVKAGAPEGIIGWLSKASMGATSELMKHPDINLILATGGGALVRAAYSSGKPAYGVGPGNVPVYIEKTADVVKSVKMIVDSKTFDNGTICATEQSMIVDRNVYEMVVRELKNNGAYILNAEEKALLEKVISPIPKKLNPAIVGQHAKKIAAMANIEVPSHTRLLIAEETKVGKDIPFSIEKLSPIFSLYVAESYEQAKDLCLQLLSIGGRGHSLALHTRDDQVSKEFAEVMPVSRLLVNTLSSVGAVGGTTGLKPSLTLGCGSFGGNITSDNVSARHLINIKRMAYGVKNVTIPQPSEKYVKREKVASNEENMEDIIAQVIKNLNPSDSIDPEVVAKTVNQVIQKYETK